MATKSYGPNAKKRERGASETSAAISEQTKAFLAAGGKIERIKPGVSGQAKLGGPKHIYLGSKPANP
jgi:hypothetical protein